MPSEVRREVIRLAAQGLSYRQIQAQLGVSTGSLCLVLAPLGGVIRKDTLAPTGQKIGRASCRERV